MRVAVLPVEFSVSRTAIMLKTFSAKIKVFFHFLTKFRRSTLSRKRLITPIVFRISVTTAFKPSTIRFSPSERTVKKCCLNICHKFFFLILLFPLRPLLNTYQNLNRMF